MKKLLLCALLIGTNLIYGQYCTTGLYINGCGSGDDLDGITLGSYTQSGTACGTAGYSDHTNDTILLVISNTSYPFTATTNYGFPDEYVGVWIDFNDDGDFDDATEFILASPNSIGGATPTYSGSITVAPGSPVGFHRMRVRIVWNTALTAFDACTNFGYGEVHDYTLNIIPNTAGNCPSFSNFVIDSIGGNTARAQWNPGGNSSFFLEYGTTGFTPGSAAGTKVTGNFPASQPKVILTGLNPQISYDVYFGEICNGGLDSVYFTDPLTFTTTKLCSEPLNFATSNITSSSVDLSWTAIGTPTYTVIYDTVGFDPNTSGNVVIATSNPFTLSGLSAATDYDIYLYADCGVDGVSDTVGPLNIKTLCVPYTIPYSMNFDSEITGEPATCWEQGLKGLDVAFQNATVENFGTPNSLPNHLNIFNYFGGDTTMAISPQFIDLPAGEKQISFYAKGTGSLVIGTMPDQSSLGQFSPLDTISLPTNYGQEFIYYLDTASGYNFSDEYVAFVHENSSIFTDVFIDNFTYDTIPPCPKPLQLTLVSTTDTSVTISFSSSGTLFDYWIGAPGSFGQGSGTFGQSGSNPLVITGLTPGTTYDVHVFNNCLPIGVSVWSGPLSVKTECSLMTLPFSENFNSDLGCFVAVDGGTSTDTWQWEPAGGTTVFGDLDGTGMAVANSDAFGNGSHMQEMLVSPVIDASTLTGGLVVEFDQFYNWIGADSAVVQVYDGAQWVSILTMNQDMGGFGNPDHQYINVTQYANANFQLRFLYDDGNVWAWFWVVDNVVIKEVLCAPSNGFTNVYTGSDSAFFNWSGTATSYVLEYGPTGFIPGAGNIGSTADTSIGITGLTPQTTYDIYLIDSCSAGLGDTLGPISFVTSCLPQTLPYIESFNVDLGCMTPVNGGGSTDTWGWEPTGGVTVTGDLDGSGFAIVNSDAHGNGVYMHEMLVSPPIDAGSLPATSAVILEFDQFYNWIGSDSAAVQVYDGSQWITLTTMHQDYGAIGAPDHRMYDLTAYANANLQVRFIYDDGNTWAWFWMIDNFSITEALCGLASNPDTLSVSPTAAMLNWTSNGANWNINWGPAGFSQGSGVTGGSLIIKNVSTNPYSLTGLMPSTCYDYYVQDTCIGIGVGPWIGPFTFCTSLGDDAELLAINFSDGPCGNNATEVSAIIRSNGINPVTTAPITVNIGGTITTTLSGTYSGSLGTSQTDTLVLGTINTYNGAFISVDGYVNMSGDQIPSNDTLISDSLAFIPFEPVGFDTAICGNIDSVFLWALPIPGVQYGWYSSATASTPVATGDSIKIATSGPKTWHLAYEESSDTLTTTFAGGTSCGAGNMFDLEAINTISITAFEVNFLTTGTKTVEVYYIPNGTFAGNETNPGAWTSAGIYSVTSLGQGVGSPVILNNPITIPAGMTYGIYVMYDAVYTSGATNFQNNDLKFIAGNGNCSSFDGCCSPRTFNGSIIYGSEACSAIRTPVSLTVGNDTAMASFTTTNSTPGNYNFDAAATVNGDHYAWDFGDGSTGTGISTSHTFATGGTYIVMLTVYDSTGCYSTSTFSDTLTFTMGIGEYELIRNLVVYPNPAKTTVTISFDLYNSKEASLRIRDVSGKEIIHFTKDVSNDRFKETIDISSLADGIYLLEIADGKIKLNTRLIKQ